MSLVSRGHKCRSKKRKREETLPKDNSANQGILWILYKTGLPANADAKYKTPKVTEKL